jgi:hypothetical protein
MGCYIVAFGQVARFLSARQSGGANTPGGGAERRGLSVVAGEQLSRHAMLRGAQSNLRRQDCELVRRYGVLEHRDGVRFYVLRKRDVERHREAEPRLQKLHDIVLVVDRDGSTIITIYRNAKALKKIRHKSKLQRLAAA